MMHVRPLIIASIALSLVACTSTPPAMPGPLSDMRLKSPRIITNSLLPVDYTCDGKEVSPPLAISKAPKGTQSFVLVADDPDAPSGLWIHWLVYNISPDVTEISEGTVPIGGVEGVTSTGETAYHGPCPPSGVHRYYFKLYALDTLLQFETPPDWATVEKAMGGHVLARAEIFARYERNAKLKMQN